MPSEMRYENCVCVDASLVVKWLVSEPDSAQALDVLEEWMRREVKMIAPPVNDCTSSNRCTSGTCILRFCSGGHGRWPFATACTRSTMRHTLLCLN